MEIKSYHKGSTEKVVIVTDASQASDEDVLNFAMRYAGEDKSSLFGHRVEWTSTQTATVRLYTD